MRNDPQTALAVVCMACCAVSIPLNPRQTLGEIDSCLVALQPDAVLVAKGVDSEARRAAEGRGITILEATQSKDGTLNFGITAPPANPDAGSVESDEPNADAPAFILQTSGTSAEPKLIPTSHRNMLAAAARVQAWFDLTPLDRCLSVSPVFYAHGLHVTVFAPLLSGGTVAFPTNASRFDYSEWFSDLRPTWYSAGPTHHRFVLDQIRVKADEKPRHSLRFVLSGGAPLPRDVWEGLQHALLVPVVEHYGSSEGMQICSNLLPPGPAKLGTVGIPWPDTIRIIGDDGRGVLPGQWGEILVGGATVVSGYLNAPELNRASFIEGWFKSGDIGSLDEDGFLTLRGRKDDLINRGGEKISPIEIDEALMRHPAVAEAAAFPVPHQRLGEDVAAAVVLRPGVPAKPVELRAYLQEQLAPFKVPQRIIIQDRLPKGQTGKILRRQLVEQLRESTAAATEDDANSVEDNRVDGELVLELTEIWKCLLKVATLSPDDDFFDSGGDSLIAVEMLAELERMTGRALPSSILLEASTIRQLAKKLSEGNYLKVESLIRLNSHGSRAPLFYLHGDCNYRGYTAVVLARLLGPDQPLFIVAPHGIGDTPIPPTVEAMAADLLPLIVEAQPSGPYRLCGNCSAGLIAFEVARLLVAAGKKVEMVIMLDPPTINARESVQILLWTIKQMRPIGGPAVDRAMAWTFLRCADIQKFYNIPWTRRWAAIKKRLQNLAAASGDQAPGLSAFAVAPGQLGTDDVLIQRSMAEQRRRAQREARYARAMSIYVPRPLAVRVVYFAIDFSAGAWRQMSSDLEIIKSPGNHYQYDFVYIAAQLTGLLQT